MTDDSAFDAIYDALDADDIDGARRALERARGTGGPHLIARAEAAILGAEGELEDAADLLFEALEEHGEDSGTRVRAAEILLAAGDARGAFECLETALEDAAIEPEVATYVRIMRVTALRQFGRYREALAALGDIETTSEPLQLEMTRERAELFAQLDRGPEALAALDAWAAADPGDPEESWLRGVTLAHLGDLAGADRALGEARERGEESAPPHRPSRATFDRLVGEVMTEIADMAAGRSPREGLVGDELDFLQDLESSAAIASGVPVEVIERGAFVVDEDGPDGPYEHGVLELAYTLGAVELADSPVGKPRKIVLVRRNLENAAGDDEGLRDAIVGAIHEVIGVFQWRATGSDAD